MLAYFPEIYPDELLYRVIGRFMCHSGIFSSRCLPEDAFGNRFWRNKTFLQTDLGRLAENLSPSRGLTAQRLATETTLLPYFTAFQPQEARGWALAALTGKNGSANPLYGRLELMPSSVRQPSALRYCPICRAEMLERHGELYWRRAHQLPGVLVCPIHCKPLADSRVIMAHTRRHEFIAADEDNCPPCPESPTWADRPEAVRLLQDIAIASATLLTTPPSARPFEAWGEEVRLALRSRGLSPRGIHISQRTLLDMFLTRFGLILDILPGTRPHKWLKAISRPLERSFAPLQHILIRLLIESLSLVEASNPFGTGPWLCRNLLAEHYGQPVITTCKTHKRKGKTIGVFRCSCGYAFSTTPESATRAKILDLGRMFKAQLRELVAAGNGLCATAKVLHVAPSTVLRHAELLGLETPWKTRYVRPRLPPIDCEAMRAAWTDGRTAAPDLNRTQLRCKIPAVYGWLDAYDRDWLDEQPPVAATNYHRGRPQFNWPALGAATAETLRQEAAQLRAQIPP